MSIFRCAIHAFTLFFTRDLTLCAVEHLEISERCWWTGNVLLQRQQLYVLPPLLLGLSFIITLHVDRCIYEAESVARVQFAYNQGHQIGSHTWAHKNLSTLSYDQVNSEMSMTEQAIQRLTGAQVAFTRPPYGEYNDNVRQVAAKRNQKLVNWSFDSGDSVGKTAAQSNALYDKLVKDHPSSVLALNHEVYSAYFRFIP